MVAGSRCPRNCHFDNYYHITRVSQNKISCAIEDGTAYWINHGNMISLSAVTVPLCQILAARYSFFKYLYNDAKPNR